MNIDYSRLSPTDFQELVADIFDTINKEKEPSETFADGKDGGIDVRKSILKKENKIIIQAKHYKDWVNLYKSLKQELPKVKNNNPERYIVTTSFDLTKTQIDTIFDLFSPYIKKKSDIWWRKKINRYLQRNKNILKNHMKLWLDSDTILNCILHKGNTIKSNTLKTEIESKIKVYVKGRNFNKLLKILSTNEYCIISGKPWIWKTTLAEMVAYYLMHHGYQLIKITNDIEEAYDLLTEDDTSKQLFYYDDFLWSNFLEQWLNSKNEDINIIDFIKTLSRLKNKKLIFTTREYILKQAFKKYNKLQDFWFENKKFVVEVNDYTQWDKVKILYNLLYHSDLDEKIKLDIIFKELYYNLIWRNKQEASQKIFNTRFNPKIVSLLLSSDRLKKEKFNNWETFITKLESILKDHNELYRDVFLEKITESSQSLLLALFSFNCKSNISELRKMWELYQKDLCLDFTEKKWSFSLKELEGTFTITNVINYWNKLDNYINFIDPFISDFFIKYLEENPKVYIRLIKLCYTWNQVKYLYSSLTLPQDEHIKEIIREKYKTLIDVDKVQKLLWLAEKGICDDGFISQELSTIQINNEYYNTDTVMKILLKFPKLPLIDHWNFIKSYIDKFNLDRIDIFDNNSISSLSTEVTIKNLENYLNMYNFDTSVIKEKIESKLKVYYNLASEFESDVLDANGEIYNLKSFFENYSRDYLSNQLDQAELLWIFISDDTVYKYIRSIVSAIESAYDDREVDERYDEWKEQELDDDLEFKDYWELFKTLV